MRKLAMYDFIFTSKLETFFFGMIISIISIFILTRGVRVLSDTIRMIFFSYSSIFALGFFFSVIFSSVAVSKFDVVAVWLLELVIFLMQLVVFISLRRRVSEGVLLAKKQRWIICVILLLVLLINIKILNYGGGYGSRLDYLSNSSLNKYFTYFAVMLFVYLSAIIAGDLNFTGRFNFFSFYILMVVFFYSLISGSKGMFFLFICQIISLINIRRYQLSFSKVIISIGVLVGMVYVSAIYISSHMGISIDQYFDLVFHRFYINNDARALAFDYRNFASSHGVPEFLINSLRSISNALGLIPNDPPLGNLLFNYLYDVDSSNGANASLAALVVYYSKDGEALLNIIAIMIGVFPIIFLLFYIVWKEHSPLRKIFYNSSLLILLILLSQDFLSFQIVLILLVFIYILLSALSMLKLIKREVQ